MADDGELGESDNPRLRAEMAKLEARVVELERETWALRSLLSASINSSSTASSTASASATAPGPVVPAPPQRPSARPAPPQTAASPDQRVWPRSPPVGSQPPPPRFGEVAQPGPQPDGSWPKQPAPTFVLSTEVAIKWAGLALLFLAGLFLVSTAISRGWIGPKLQLTGAVLGGLVLIGAGLWLRDRKGWTEPLIGVGLAVLFVSSGAAWEWLDLGSALVSATLAVLVGGLGLALARSLSAASLAIVALVGLIFVPLWLDLHESLDLVYSIYYLLALVGVYSYFYLAEQWTVPWVLAVALSALLVFREAISDDLRIGRAFSDEQAASVGAVSLVGLLGLGALYWFSPILSGRHGGPQAQPASGQPASGQREVPPGGDLLATGGGGAYRVALLTPLWLWFCLDQFLEASSSLSTTLGLGLVAAVAAVLYATRQMVSRPFVVTQLMAGTILLAAVTLRAIDGPMLLVVIGIQAAVLVTLIRHLDDTWFTVQAVVGAVLVLVVAMGRMLLALVSDAQWSDDLANLVIVVLLAGVSLVELGRSGLFDRTATGVPDHSEVPDPQNQSSGKRLALAGLGASYAGLLLWVGSFFGHMVQGQGQVSALWSIFAAALIAFALTQHSMPVLRVGLATLGLVVVKLLTVDLAAVDTFWRVGLFFVIGAGLLGLSYQLPRLMGLSPKERSQTE